jgi:fructose/tagatose bisphosphate aldolase
LKDKFVIKWIFIYSSGLSIYNKVKSWEYGGLKVNIDTAAFLEMIKKFYEVGQNQEVTVKELIEAMKVELQGLQRV